MYGSHAQRKNARQLDTKQEALYSNNDAGLTSVI